MKLYEPSNMEKKPEQPVWAVMLGKSIGMILGAAASVALETTIIWALVVFLIGLPLTWVQIFGCLLVFNGLVARFSYYTSKDDK